MLFSPSAVASNFVYQCHSQGRELAVAREASVTSEVTLTELVQHRSTSTVVRTPRRPPGIHAPRGPGQRDWIPPRRGARPAKKHGGGGGGIRARPAIRPRLPPRAGGLLACRRAGGAPAPHGGGRRRRRHHEAPSAAAVATCTTAHRDRLVMQPAPSPHRGVVTCRVAAPPSAAVARPPVDRSASWAVCSLPPAVPSCGSWRTVVKMPGETAKVRRTLHCISCDTTLVSLHHFFL